MNSHDLKYINANQVHGFVKPADSKIRGQETEAGAEGRPGMNNNRPLTVIHPNNI